MTPAMRKRLQKALIFLSFLVAVAATVLWYRCKTSGAPVPMWLLGVLGYAWTFMGFLLINFAARSYARKRHPRSGQGQ